MICALFQVYGQAETRIAGAAVKVSHSSSKWARRAVRELYWTVRFLHIPKQNGPVPSQPQLCGSVRHSSLAVHYTWYKSLDAVGFIRKSTRTLLRPLMNNSLVRSFDVIAYYRYSKTATLSHPWLGDLVELKHLTKDIYLGKFSDNMYNFHDLDQN